MEHAERSHLISPISLLGGVLSGTPAQGWEFFIRYCAHIGEDTCPVVWWSGRWMDQPPQHTATVNSRQSTKINKGIWRVNKWICRQRGVKRQRKVSISWHPLWLEDGTWSQRVCDRLKLQWKVDCILAQGSWEWSLGQSEKWESEGLPRREVTWILCLNTAQGRLGFGVQLVICGYTPRTGASTKSCEHPGVLTEEAGIPESVPQGSWGTAWDLHCHPPQVRQSLPFQFNQVNCLLRKSINNVGMNTTELSLDYKTFTMSRL